MLCPYCQYDNLDGMDLCESCRADLRHLDAPGAKARSKFRRALFETRLADVEVPEPLVFPPSATLGEVIPAMRKAGRGSVLVVERQGSATGEAPKDRLVGIFTERDVLKKVVQKNLDYARTTVGELMKRDPVILRPHDNLAVALNKMSVGGFRRIPFVTAEGKIGRVDAIHVLSHLCKVAGS